MKIFCIGLPKTGTSSLDKVLAENGVKIYSNSWDIVLAKSLMKGDFNIFSLDHIKGFDGMGDMPAAIYWQELFSAYPDAKFILTTRELDSWLESCMCWWERLEIRGHQVTDVWSEIDTNQTTALSFLKAALFGTYLYNEDRFRHVHRDHAASVDAVRRQGNQDRFLYLPLEIPDKDKCRLLSEFLDLDVKEYAKINVRSE